MKIEREILDVSSLEQLKQTKPDRFYEIFHGIDNWQIKFFMGTAEESPVFDGEGSTFEEALKKLTEKIPTT